MVAGAAAGFIAENPVEGFALGVMTHVILDMIPHKDHESVVNCVLDTVLGTIAFLIVMVMYKPDMSIVWGAVGGVLPDIEIPLYYFRIIKRRFFPSHNGLVPHLSTTRGRSFLVQGLVIILGLWILS